MEDLLAKLTCGSDEAAEAAVQPLAELGEKAVPALRELARSTEADNRWWAVRVLAEIDHPEGSTLFETALGDPVLAVRQCAALALRKQPSPQAIPALQKALNQGDRLLARLAADALVAAGDASVPALLDTVADGEPRARVEAIRALALLPDLRAVPALFAALDDGSPVIEYWADIGLQRRGIGMMFFSP